MHPLCYFLLSTTSHATNSISYFPMEKTTTSNYPTSLFSTRKSSYLAKKLLNTLLLPSFGPCPTTSVCNLHIPTSHSGLQSVTTSLPLSLISKSIDEATHVHPLLLAGVMLANSHLLQRNTISLIVSVDRRTRFMLLKNLVSC